MSLAHTPLTPELAEYLNTNFSAEDEFLQKLKEEAASEGLPQIAIAPEQGKILQTLIKANNAKNILEIGTLAGYSAIIMARALPDNGNLITVESEFKHALFAQKKIKEAGLEHIIQVQNSTGRDFLEEFEPEEEFDVIFVDADKPSYKYYLDKTTKFLKKGGMFIADNAFAFGYLLTETTERNPNEIKSIQGFNLYLKNHPQYLTSVIPLGDGLIVGVKIA